MKNALILACVVILMGCTEKLPFEETYSEDTDWTPNTSILYNGYHRIVVQFDRPPRKELLRNIVEFGIEVRTADPTNSVIISDAIDGIQLPSYVLSYGGELSPLQHQTGALLADNKNYVLNVTVTYRNGVKTSAEEIQFVTPMVRGQILRRIAFPAKTSQSRMWYMDNYLFGFSRGKLIMLKDDELFSVDTSSGVSTLLMSRFAPPAGLDHNLAFRRMAIYGDTAVFAYNIDFERTVLWKLNLSTQRVDSSISCGLSSNNVEAMTSDGTSIYFLVWFGYTGRQQIIKINPANGDTMQIYAQLPGRFVTYPSTICSDGANLWTVANNRFDNRVVRFDPSTFAILEEHQNVVFSPERLAWDGAHFWVVDRDTHSVVKLKLEGL